MRSFLLACALCSVACGGTVASKTSPTTAEAGSDSSAQTIPVEAGTPDTSVFPPPPPGGCPNCADESLFCDIDSGTCVLCLTDQNCVYQGPGNPNAVCLPDHTCGCTTDTQCAGRPEGARCVASLQQCGCNGPSDCSAPSTLTCAANHVCGCGSNQDCAGDGGVGAGRGPVCRTDTGKCVECVADSDCTDPDNKVCDPTMNVCLPCRVNADCAKNSDGPVCGDLGQYTVGIGACGCTADSQCPGHNRGPRCVSNGSPYNKCGCGAAADCAGDPLGHACVNPYTDGWMQCGCTTTTDCATGMTCNGNTCQ